MVLNENRPHGQSPQFSSEIPSFQVEMYSALLELQSFKQLGLYNSTVAFFTVKFMAVPFAALI